MGPIRDADENFIKYINMESVLDLIDILESGRQGDFELEINDGRITAVVFYGR